MARRMTLAAAIALGAATYSFSIQAAAAKDVASTDGGTKLGHPAIEIDPSSALGTKPPVSKAALTNPTGPTASNTAQIPRKRYPHMKGVYASE